MSSGWSGNILRVDLSKKESTTVATAPYTRSFIGGRGISVKIVYDEVDSKISPFDPANRLLFGPGVLTGTPAPTAARMAITTMCPNGLIGSSGIGGFIGAEIRHAGYDNIIIQGKSDNPVYLYIHDDVVEFRDANQVWGKDTLETQRIIKRETGDPDVRVVCIGPGGENMVSFACIRTGIFSTAGRGGMGAIMGSKNLKAIAVRGKHGVEIARLQEFLKLSSEISKMVLERQGKQRPGGKRNNDINVLAIRRGIVFGNWEDVGWDEINAESFVHGDDEFYDQHYITRAGCFGCLKTHLKVCDDPETGIGVAKCYLPPSFTFRVWNKDYQVMISACHLCSQYGLDVISTANIIAFLMELYHRGIITEKDTDGIPMKRGDKEAIISTIHKIGKQEGFGKFLRDGVLNAARTIGKGAEECAMHIKGLEMASQEFRGRKGTALANVITPKPGGNENPRPESVWGIRATGKDAVHPASYDNKALMVWEWANNYKVTDMLGTCKTVIPWTIGQSLELPARLLSLATGVDTSEDDLLTAAQRVQVLERAFDVMRGIRRKDDTLPERMFKTAVTDGPFKGERLEKAKFDKMLDEYYALCGWDEDGVPKEETFQKYGLSSEWEAFSGKIKNGANITSK